MLEATGWTVGPLAENPYLVRCTSTNEAVLIDPGDEAPMLLRAIADSGATVKAILLTHAHLDHVGALTDMREALGVPVYLHSADDALLAEAHIHWLRFGKSIAPVAPAEHALAPGNTLTVGDGVLDVLYTPGHTQGGVCFYSAPDALLIAGDTLFRRSVGRTDLPGGNTRQLIASIHSQLYTLPDETVVYPGHGGATTIGEEKQFNPFT